VGFRPRSAGGMWLGEASRPGEVGRCLQGRCYGSDSDDIYSGHAVVVVVLGHATSSGARRECCLWCSKGNENRRVCEPSSARPLGCRPVTGWERRQWSRGPGHRARGPDRGPRPSPGSPQRIASSSLTGAGPAMAPTRPRVIAVPLQQRNGALPVILRVQLVGLALVLPFALAGLPGSRCAWSGAPR
jgi:hypothetical protein